MEEITRHLVTAKERYERVEFLTDSPFNKPAPDPSVAFVIGGVSCAQSLRNLSSAECCRWVLYYSQFSPLRLLYYQVLGLIGIGMWFYRIRALKKRMAARTPPIKLTGNALMRALISCGIDSDSPFYVIVSYGSVSFLFLGGIQLHYKWTLLCMIVVYVISALGESARVLLAFSSARSLADVVLTSKFLASKLRTVSTELSPSNVYEDLGRGKTIVVMVFITQVILISFVVSSAVD